MIAAEAGTKVSPERVQAIAEMLGEAPAGLGRPASDRAAWAALAPKPVFAKVVQDAAKLLATPLPAQPDELYLEFSRNGNRTHWQDVAFKRRAWVRTLVLAECLENQGRFLPVLTEVVHALAAEPTWVMPAHDGNLANFHGKAADIDLASAALAWELASADWLLGARLDPELRALMRDNVRRRVLDPFRDMVEGRRKENWWLTTTNNWNAVCLAGVTGAALALIEPRDERAFYVAAAEAYSQNFLKGFTADGYCSEGVGYWNYGFGHYVLLAETIRQASSGRIDLLRGEAVRMPARYPLRIEIANGVFPAFADCAVDARPTRRLLAFLSRRFGFAVPGAEAMDLATPEGTLFEALLYSFADSATTAIKPEARPVLVTHDTLRSWFGDAGILICRPAEGTAGRFAVALKGGNNAEHHNHNDLGSFVVVIGKTPVLLDPGAEVYTARTFGPHRYDSQALNSFGHPVPKVAGVLQRPGADARAKVLKSEFGDAQDTLAFDLRSAYEVPGLEQLERTFVYSRENGGSLTVTDTVRFASPQAFETALITLGAWKRDGDTLAVTDGKATVLVRVAVSGGEFDVTEDVIREDMHTKAPPKRLGIVLRQPVTAASVTLSMGPGK